MKALLFDTGQHRGKASERRTPACNVRHVLWAGRLSQAEISRQSGVSRANARDCLHLVPDRWAQTIEAQGPRGLRKRKAAGTQSNLRVAQR